jgi:Cdc6-like AAA superfamily ATPase
VTIVGPQGIGKTALSKMVAHHLLDRSIFSDGIVFLNLRGIKTSQGFLELLAEKITE